VTNFIEILELFIAPIAALFQRGAYLVAMLC